MVVKEMTLMNSLQPNNIRTAVRNVYGQIARSRAPVTCCEPRTVDLTDASDENETQCCSSGSSFYSPDELARIPEGSNLGLGCGHPTMLAILQVGEWVLDLGCGAGIDSFLAAEQVGPCGWVIGVDMTPEMIERARLHAEQAGIFNVEFRLGEIEHLPLADASVDVVISNCVINLSPDKRAVFKEAFRVLKDGGRLIVSDIVQQNDIPETMKEDLRLIVGCIGGAAPVRDLEEELRHAGFEDVRIAIQDKRKNGWLDHRPKVRAEEFIISATIEARKGTEPPRVNRIS